MYTYETSRSGTLAVGLGFPRPKNKAKHCGPGISGPLYCLHIPHQSRIAWRPVLYLYDMGRLVASRLQMGTAMHRHRVAQIQGRIDVDVHCD